MRSFRLLIILTFFVVHPVLPGHQYGWIITKTVKKIFTRSRFDPSRNVLKVCFSAWPWRKNSHRPARPRKPGLAFPFCSLTKRHQFSQHFVANSDYGGRDSWAQYLPERYLQEVYFPPNKEPIERAGILSIMPSYGSLNGFRTVCNHWLLTEKTRGDWNFKGYSGAKFPGAV